MSTSFTQTIPADALVLRGPSERRISLTILNADAAIQYRRRDDPGYEHHFFLKLLVDVQIPEGKWRAVAPVLLDTEAKPLFSWLDGLARGASSDTTCTFLEAGLRFDIPPDGPGLARAIFSYDLCPPWASSQGFSEHEVPVAFWTHTSPLRRALDNWWPQIEHLGE